jgi:hypothetical protein
MGRKLPPGVTGITVTPFQPDGTCGLGIALPLNDNEYNMTAEILKIHLKQML